MQCPLDIPHAFDYGQKCCRYEQDYNENSLSFASVSCKDDLYLSCLKERCIANGETVKLSSKQNKKELAF